MEVFTRFVRQLSVILNCPANVVKAYLPDKFALSGKWSFNGQGKVAEGMAIWAITTSGLIFFYNSNIIITSCNVLLFSMEVLWNKLLKNA